MEAMNTGEPFAGLIPMVIFVFAFGPMAVAGKSWCCITILYWLRPTNGVGSASRQKSDPAG